MSVKFGNLGWDTIAQEIAKMAAREVARRLLNKSFERVRLHHVVGALAFAVGQVGLFLYSAVLYAWCRFVAPADVGLAFHSPFYGEVTLLLTVYWVILFFSLGAFGSVALLANGISWFDPDSDPAKLVRRIPLLRRFVMKPRKKPVLSNRSTYIVLE